MKSVPVAQQQWLKQQQHNVGGSFARQLVVAVVMVAVLAMALAKQWQQ
jgi:hypothetical protein